MNPRNWCLIQIPDHEGVLNVGGRVGAARGPDALWKTFSRLRGRDQVHHTLAPPYRVSPLTSDVSKNHRQAADVIREAQHNHGITVVVGGGHDHGFSQLLGVREWLDKRKSLGCINIDAHLDVRKPSPLVSSGSPFYLAIETKTLAPKNLIEFGIQRHCNGPELWDYVESRKIQVVPFEDLRHGKAIAQFKQVLKKLSARCHAIVISLDLDSAASAFAPGVSAPQAEGFSSSEILEMIELAGASPKVVSLGIFELNPEHDLDDRTARLGATAAYHFAASALNRKAKRSF